MIPNLDDVKRWQRRGVDVVFCNVWCREPQGREPQWIGEAKPTRYQCEVAAMGAVKSAHFVGYRLRIQLKPEAFA
ncbi:MAG: hypothetical protein DI589_06670 [Shinella sp.]|nr:MAG: hypothetical protein DI589_06670 [Shinella sp.]